MLRYADSWAESAALRMTQKRRLAFAYREIEYVPERANAQGLRTAAPRDPEPMERAGLVPVTAAELQAVGARLHELLGHVR